MRRLSDTAAKPIDEVQPLVAAGLGQLIALAKYMAQDRGAYVCVQRGGECDSFAVSVYCAAADGGRGVCFIRGRWRELSAI